MSPKQTKKNTRLHLDGMIWIWGRVFKRPIWTQLKVIENEFMQTSLMVKKFKFKEFPGYSIYNTKKEKEKRNLKILKKRELQGLEKMNSTK